MKKLFLLVAMTMFIAAATQAQEPEQVTLKLKNGATVSGKVINEGDDSMKIQTPEGDVFIYRINEISRIEGRDTADSGETQMQKRSINGYGGAKGYRSFLDAGYSYGIDDGGSDRVSLTYIGGYNFSSYLYVGLGFGVSVTDLIGGNAELGLPIFAHIRSAFLKKSRTSPFISVNVGYSVALSKSEEFTPSWGDYYGGFREYDYSGIYLEPCIGFEVRSKKPEKKSAFQMGVIFTMLSNLNTYTGVGLKLGYSF